MKPLFITHPDFADAIPLDVFHKEQEPPHFTPHDASFGNRHILFRRCFSLPAFSRATLHITADDHYKLYCNGRFVAEGPSPSYPNVTYVQELDLTPYLQPGENLMAVHVYYQGLINRVWVSGDLRTMLYCKLSVDGKEVLVSDESFHTAFHTGYLPDHILGYQTAYAEIYDSRAPEVGFERTDFDDSSWKKAAVFRHADYRLLPQPTLPLTYEEDTPQRMEIRQADHGTVLFCDFGQETAGTLTAIACGTAGAQIGLCYGEELTRDGSVRYQMRCNCDYREGWILSGTTDTLTQYDYKAFRYAELHLPEGVQIKDVKRITRHYPFVRKATYNNASPRLAPILRLCENTIRYGVQEVFVDCPTREKGQYLGDLAVAGRAQAILTGDCTMLKKGILDFVHSAFLCPGLMAVSTASLMQEIADYSLIFPALVLWVYRRDGDLTFVRACENALLGVDAYFSAHLNEDGLPEGITEKWNMVDWPENLRDGYAFPLTRPIGPGVHNVLAALWCGCLHALEELYTLLGRAFSPRAKYAKDVFIRTFYDAERGLFCDTPAHTHTAIHSNVLPLLFDIGTEDPARRARLIACLKEKRLTSMGVYMAYFALAALIRHGEKALAEELALDENAWPRMLREGATTTFEAWGADEKWNTSLFHPWATAPAIVFADHALPY